MMAASGSAAAAAGIAMRIAAIAASMINRRLLIEPPLLMWANLGC
jgi:hypothetical protein